MPAWYHTCVCLCLSITSRNCWTVQADFWQTFDLSYTVLQGKSDISKKIRVLTSGTLPQTLYREKISPWQIDHVVTLTTIAAPFAWQSILYTRGARRLLHFRQSYCSNSITLTCCGFVVQLVPQLYSSWQDFDWHRASHGWLSSRVVSMLDSGAVGPGFISQPRRCRVTVLGKLFTPVVPLFTKQPS